MENCKCGNNVAFDECCDKYISGAANPLTAEALMRSRYTAYVVGNIDYIVETTLPDMQEGVNVEATKSWSEDSNWMGLTIHTAEKGGEDDEFGYVDFTAKYTHLGDMKEHREKAFFKKENDRWYFVPETKQPIRRSEKIGRNDPCPCESGKKYKKCCGKA